MDIRNLIRENIRNLAPYSTARDDYQGTELSIALDANENPYDNGVNRYPDPRQKALKARLSQIKGVPVESIFVGNGSDEPIDLVYRVFCEPKVHNAVAIAPTYSMYKVAAEINDVEVREVQLEEDFSLDADKLLAATDANTRLLWLCSPTNPTASPRRPSNGSSANSQESWCSTKRTSTSPQSRAFSRASANFRT